MRSHSDGVADHLSSDKLALWQPFCILWKSSQFGWGKSSPSQKKRLGMAWAPHPFLFGQSIWQLLLPSGQWTMHRAGGVRRPRRMTPWSLSDHPEGGFGACIKIVQQTARPKPKACTSRKNVCCWPCALLRKDQPYIDLPRLWLVNCWSTVARKHAGVAVSGDENDQKLCNVYTNFNWIQPLRVTHIPWITMNYRVRSLKWPSQTSKPSFFHVLFNHIRMVSNWSNSWHRLNKTSTIWIRSKMLDVAGITIINES